MLIDDNIATIMTIIFLKYIFFVKKGVQPFLRLSNSRLPPSDPHVQQARNSPRLMSVNLPTACPRTLNDWRYSELENKSIKAQYPKSIKNGNAWLEYFEVNLILSLCLG